jgi:nitrilase
MSKIAVIQHPPVLANRTATVDRAVELAREAVNEGAELLVFPETFIPGYPTWVWRLKPGGDMRLSSELHDLLVDNAVDLSRDDLAPLCELASTRRVHILCGIDEISPEQSRTLYNTYVHIDAEGEIVNRHRKLMPTNPERMVWGFGDGSGLRVIDTPVGRVGSLICWENFMPLARMALYGQGIDVLCTPTWDSSEGWLGSMQHIAREGRCYVANCCTAMRVSDIPDDLPGKQHIFQSADEQINVGNSCLIEPGGNIISGPCSGEPTILYADVDRQKVASSRRSLDVAGHYNRPDVFQFDVNRQPQRSVRFCD